jgi:hypothetical protein
LLNRHFTFNNFLKVGNGWQNDPFTIVKQHCLLPSFMHSANSKSTYYINTFTAILDLLLLLILLLLLLLLL